MITMKPETLARRAKERRAETIRRQTEAVERAAEAVARHKAKGDYMSAAIFAEIMVECQERLDFTLSHFATRETHVVVGDHSPEARADYRSVEDWIKDNPNDGSGRPS